MSDPLDCALDLLRRLPPSKVVSNVEKILASNPDIGDDLLAMVDQPLVVAKCSVTEKEFLQCDYNRDGKSFRSPWSGEFQPPADGYKPTGPLLTLENSANEAFAVYCDLYSVFTRYYGGGISSVYCWELETGFAMAVLIKKASPDLQGGSWDSIHIVEIEPGKTSNYKLTSTILLQIVSKNDKGPTIELGGSLTRQAEGSFPVDNQSVHIQNVGKMIEDMENKMRNTMQEIYFGKTRDVVNELKSARELKAVSAQNSIQAQLVNNLKATKK